MLDTHCIVRSTSVTQSDPSACPPHPFLTLFLSLYLFLSFFLHNVYLASPLCHSPCNVPLSTSIGLSCGSEGRFMVLSCHNPDEVRNPHRFQPAYDESTQQCSPRYGESEYTGNRQFVTPACDPLTVRNYRKKHTEYTQGLQRAIRVLEMKGQV